jgi:tRNA-splicing ligase RtcB
MVMSCHNVQWLLWLWRPWLLWLQVCTDYLQACDRAMARSAIRLVDRQLAAAPLSSQEGKDNLAAMAAAANYAFTNR